MSLNLRTCAAVFAAMALAAATSCAPQDAAPAAGPTPTGSASTIASASASASASTSTSTSTSAGSSSSASSSSSTNPCAKDQLTVHTAGKLTVGTDKPAYEPWFSKDDPTNGQGYESAVAYAVAKQLGFAKDDVSWVVVPFTNAYAPGAKKFDVDINQISITEARRKAVDFSSGYYDVAQSIVTTKDSPIANAKSIADLKNAKLSAQVGTTSYTAINDQIHPDNKAAVFDTNDLAVQALKNGQVDGIVVDLPTAFYMAAAQLDSGVILGQLPNGSGQPDQFGMVLDKGSPLTACVSKAVDTLRSNGTLKQLQKKWLTSAGAPALS